MFENALKWTYTTLRGLHTNKNTFHLDRAGFLQYLNIENLKNFSRLRRGGSSLATNQLSLSSYNEDLFPNNAKDFSYIDNVNNTHKTILMFSAKKALYKIDGTTLSEIDLPDMSSGFHDNIFQKWSLIPFKNRLLICTGIHSHLKNSNTLTVGSDKKTITGFGSLSTNYAKKGDILVLNGVNCEVDTVVSSNEIKLKNEYTALPSSSITNWRYIYKRVSNFLIYDPNDLRTGANPISYCGAIAPPTQIIYDTTYYYDESISNGWIYRGKPGQTSNITAKTGDSFITITNANDMTSYIQSGDYIYIDDVEYEIDYVTYNTSANGTLTVYLKNSKGFQELFIDNYAIATSQNYKGNGLDHWWAIYYGELSCINGGYKYGYAYYNSKSGHMSNLSPLVDILSPYKKFNILITFWNSLTNDDPLNHCHYDTIIFFRSVNGGVLLYEVGRISSTLNPTTNDYLDNKTDENLGSIIGEQWFNAPPPEFLAIEEWIGRIWGVGALERDKLYFSMDDIQLASRSNTGRAEECYPATNYIVVPAEDGKITGLKKAGDYLYVATDKNLYVVTGDNESNFGLEKIFTGHGIKQEAMCEYTGLLSRRPGLFFVTNNYQAFIITPDILKNIGENIEDKLREAGYFGNVSVHRINSSQMTLANINGYNYSSLKARNYIIVSFRSYETLNWVHYVYDIDFDEWYEHKFNYANGAYDRMCNLFYSSNIHRYPIPFGCFIDYTTSYNITPVLIYNDEQYEDYNGSYEAYLQTSWLDFDSREMHKTLCMGKIYLPISSSSYTASLFIDESITEISLKNNNFTYQESPYQEGKEHSLVFLDTNSSLVKGHLFSVKINYPGSVKQEEIYNIDLLFQVIGTIRYER